MLLTISTPSQSSAQFFRAQAHPIVLFFHVWLCSKVYDFNARHGVQHKDEAATRKGWIKAWNMAITADSPKLELTIQETMQHMLQGKVPEWIEKVQSTGWGISVSHQSVSRQGHSHHVIPVCAFLNMCVYVCAGGHTL